MGKGRTDKSGCHDTVKGRDCHTPTTERIFTGIPASKIKRGDIEVALNLFKDNVEWVEVQSRNDREDETGNVMRDYWDEDKRKWAQPGLVKQYLNDQVSQIFYKSTMVKIKDDENSDDLVVISTGKRIGKRKNKVKYFKFIINTKTRMISISAGIRDYQTDYWENEGRRLK